MTIQIRFHVYVVHSISLLMKNGISDYVCVRATSFNDRWGNILLVFCTQSIVLSRSLSVPS